MKSQRPFILITIASTLAIFTDPAAATLYCNRASAELVQNPGRPFNAVGFLNNGCTAFLVDANHIVAAAHCFENTTTGEWQTGLRFYPNFHPNRVIADDKHVPSGNVTRMVVGSRAGESVLGSGMDWGIAYIRIWKNTAGLDMKPLSLSSSIPAAGTALSNPAYTRHHFPYNDNDTVAWDNMIWDTTHCGWVGANHGMWAITMRTAPFYDGVHRDTVGCNSRWGSGFMHENCALTQVTGDVIMHNCDTIGGSSGSPIMYKNRSGAWYAIGVGHGGGSASTASSNDFSMLNPVCSPDVAANRDNVGASVARFRYAPRFASNVAVHRRPDQASATAVFAVDSDLNTVVYRARTGASPNYNSPFRFWINLGSPHAGSALSKIAACSADAAAKPQVFVVVDNIKIYTRHIQSNGVWSSWSDFGVASGAKKVQDIDATADANGRCQLLIVSNDGLFTRAKSSDTVWNAWQKAVSGSYQNVTALNYNGVIWAAMLDTSRQVWRTSKTTSEWSVPTKLSPPLGIVGWNDIDMTWDEAARGFMLAIAKGGGNKLYFMPMYGNQAWIQWRHFDTRLWAPGAVSANTPLMHSVTASRWMEDPQGVTSPLIFATDDFGNIYFIEYGRVGTPGWILDWKSFYHETIPY